MIKIKKGDIVDIIAPAGFSTPEKLIKAVDEIRKWGLIPRSKINFSSTHPYHSDEDNVRLADLKEAIESDSKVIWCLRGGYGSARLLESLIKIKKPVQKKILIGYSDITALHLFVNQKWGWESIHGPMISTFSDAQFEQSCIKELKSMLLGKITKSDFKLMPMNEYANFKNIKFSGELIGGNLAIIQTMIGTKFKMNTDKKIIFLEDINEKGYQVDRMLNHLQMTKAFEGAKAIIFGDFSGGLESSGENHVEFALSRFALQQKIPIFRSAEFGHGKINRPLICGHKYRIEKNKLSLTF